jgi:hypothetical protein
VSDSAFLFLVLVALNVAVAGVVFEVSKLRRRRR